MQQSIELRQFTDALNFPEDENKRSRFVETIISPFKFVLVMGLSGTGKSTFLSHYRGKKNWTHTLWNRDTIFDMMWNDGTRVDNFYGKIDKFEADILPELFVQPYHHVIVESWARMQSVRKRYMSYFPKGIGQSAILVFDGPPELIIKRNLEKGNDVKFNKSPEDLKLFLKLKHETTQWPTFQEGYDRIYYINTFGKAGEEYLLQRLR